MFLDVSLLVLFLSCGLQQAELAMPRIGELADYLDQGSGEASAVEGELTRDRKPQDFGQGYPQSRSIRLVNALHELVMR